MAKRIQQESGEERVTAKSRPMSRLQLHQARGRDGTEIKILGNLLL